MRGQPNGYFSFGGNSEGEDHTQALAALLDELTKSGALLAQLCRWKAYALPAPNIDEPACTVHAIRECQELAGTWGGQQHFARASYKCGCWIEWQDRKIRAALPLPSLDKDEFEFAALHLGPLVKEFACKAHGGPMLCSPSDDETLWWTARRCVAAGGHLEPVSSACPRCGTDCGASE
jgi:hypothetical protein